MYKWIYCYDNKTTARRMEWCSLVDPNPDRSLNPDYYEFPYQFWIHSQTGILKNLDYFTFFMISRNNF